MDGFEFSLYEIDEALRDIIPESKRRECTPRVCEALGMNALLDMRNALRDTMLEYEREFNGA